MKRFFGFAMLLVLISAPAFAKNSQTVNIPENVNVGTTKVAAGAYKVEWTGTGSNVQVVVSKEGKTIVTAAAKIVDEKHDYKAVTTLRKDGTDVLETIILGKQTLVFETAPTSGQ